MCSNVIFIPHFTMNTFNILCLGWIIDILKAETRGSDPLDSCCLHIKWIWWRRHHIESGQVYPICVTLQVQWVSELSLQICHCDISPMFKWFTIKDSFAVFNFNKWMKLCCLSNIVIAVRFKSTCCKSASCQIFQFLLLLILMFCSIGMICFSLTCFVF